MRSSIWGLSLFDLLFPSQDDPLAWRLLKIAPRLNMAWSFPGSVGKEYLCLAKADQTNPLMVTNGDPEHCSADHSFIIHFFMCFSFLKSFPASRWAISTKVYKKKRAWVGLQGIDIASAAYLYNSRVITHAWYSLSPSCCKQTEGCPPVRKVTWFDVKLAYLSLGIEV